MLTGEACPVQKQKEESVYGGTILTKGALLVKVTKTTDDAAINQIMKLVEQAQTVKAPIQGVADTLAKYFVPMIVLLALITWAFWFSFVYSELG